MNTELKLYGVLGAAVFIVAMLMMSVVTIDQGDRAVVTTFGEVSGEMEPGLNFRAPIVQGVHTYTVREQLASYGYEGSNNNELTFKQIDAKTAGGPDMSTDIGVRFRLDAENVTDVYTELGSEQQYYKKLVENEFDSVIRNAASGYTVDELHSQEGRESFQDDVYERLNRKLENYGFTATEISLKNINFADSIEEAINAAEAKQYEIKEQRRAVEVEEARADKRRAEAEGLRDSEQIATEAFESESAYLQYLFITEALANEKATNPIYVPTSRSGGLEMFKDIDNVNPQGTQVANATE